MLAESYGAALQMKTGQKFVPCVPHEFSYRLKVLHHEW